MEIVSISFDMLDILLILLYLGGAREMWNYKQDTPWYFMAIILILWPLAIGAAIVNWVGSVLDAQEIMKFRKVKSKGE